MKTLISAAIGLITALFLIPAITVNKQTDTLVTAAHYEYHEPIEVVEGKQKIDTLKTNLRLVLRELDAVQTQ